MTDATPAPKSTRSKKTEDAEIVDAEVVEETAHSSATEPVVATVEPDSVETGEPAASTGSYERVVYVTAPAAPRKLGNRGLGSVLAVASAVVFLALYAVATALIGVARGAAFGFDFLTQPVFYAPALFYVIATVIVVLLVNRAAWWVHIIASIVVGLVVYFGTIGLALLTSGIVQNTPAEAAERFGAALLDPFVIVAALLAREVALWTGALIARRGRTLKARNVEAHEAWEREVAQKRAEAEARQ